MNKISASISLNFSLAKVASILCVVASHWFYESRLWVLAVTGLFIFGFSSMYFTATNEGTHVNLFKFWKRKLERLGVRYWFLLTVIMLYCAAQGMTVFHWHTLVHYVGLSGALNLFGSSESAVGMGLWFYSVLLMFYLIYPALAVYFTRYPSPYCAPALATLLLISIQVFYNPGYFFYMTILSFTLGIYCGLNQVNLSKLQMMAMLLCGLIAFSIFSVVAKNVFASTASLFVFAFASCLLLTKIELSANVFLKKLAKLEAYLLEVFLIHMYLFVRPSGNSYLDFGISLILIWVVAIGLNFLGNKLVAFVFNKTSSINKIRGVPV